MTRNCLCGNVACEIPYGHCHCGCGRHTATAKRTEGRHGYVAGMPKRYARGHHLAKLRSLEDAAPFKIDGVYCRIIPLTNGFWAIVDAEDYPRLAVHKWQALDLDGRIVAGRSISKPRKTVIYMHQDILPRVKDIGTDHVNRLPVDNRRKNLRYATALQNSRNKGTTRKNTSGYKGVSFHLRTGKWKACIRVHGKLISLGLHHTKEAAARAYDAAAIDYFGEFAYVNFPPPQLAVTAT